MSLLLLATEQTEAPSTLRRRGLLLLLLLLRGRRILLLLFLVLLTLRNGLLGRVDNGLSWNEQAGFDSECVHVESRHIVVRDVKERHLLLLLGCHCAGTTFRERKSSDIEAFFIGADLSTGRGEPLARDALIIRLEVRVERIERRRIQRQTIRDKVVLGLVVGGRERREVERLAQCGGCGASLAGVEFGAGVQGQR